jgi:hypothetical protein
MSLKPNLKEINIILSILKGAQFEFLPRAPFYIDTPLPLGLREVKAPTLLRQAFNRWRQGCQPYAPAHTLPPGFFIFKDSWYSFLLEAESTPGPARPEGLGQFKKVHLIGT